MTIRKSKNMKKANNQKRLDWTTGVTFLMALITVLELRGANIRIVMVNGDSILTKVTMVRDCGTVSHGEDSIRFEAGVVRGKVKSEKVNNRNRDISTLPLVITTSSFLYKWQPLS